MAWLDDQIKTHADVVDIARDGLRFEVTELIAEAMKRSRTTKAKLAKRLNTNQAAVTRMLMGENMRLDRLADVLLACGCTASMRPEYTLSAHMKKKLAYED